MNDKRIILTLDAGGTNFVFSAIQNGKAIVDDVKMSANAHDYDMCIGNIFSGFNKVKEMVGGEVDAISFAFPGPADYQHGIIGNLPNFDAFNDSTPLGPMLEAEFNVPVFINNDGNLFAYGEALMGFLPDINRKIVELGGIKQFNNLIGLTLGTGFGGGIVINNNLVIGDSSCGAEVHNTLNKFNADWNAEESVSTRAIQRVYAEETGLLFSDVLMPVDIADIAKGKQEGDSKSAVEAFKRFGEALGSSIANITTLFDGLVVLGGGITAAWDMFAPAMFHEINRSYLHHTGTPNDRLSFKIFNLEDDKLMGKFANGSIEKLQIGNKSFDYDSMPRTGVGVSKLGASHSISLGAYIYAIQQLNK